MKNSYKNSKRQKTQNITIKNPRMPYFYDMNFIFYIFKNSRLFKGY